MSAQLIVHTPALAVYLHFPWCVSKCPYCDFNSHALRGELPEKNYIDTMIADLTAQSSRVAAGRSITSVFMGGGTPSLFSPQSLARVLEALHKLFTVADDMEVTLEANPATVERGRFAEYFGAGINRVSLGAQSFDPAALRALGRIHVVKDVQRAAEELHACGLNNFNLDLMFALPDQSRASALADVCAALALQPAHLSHYQLTLEPGTVFAAQPPALPDEDLAWQMQTDCHAVLAESGFAQYEVSAFARTGFQCRHNLNYWSFGDYLGVGAGAHGKLSSDNLNRIERSTHLREPRRYQAGAAQGPQWRVVPQKDLPFEFMMNALRLKAGFAPDEFTATTGLPRSAIAGELAELEARSLIEALNGRSRATPLGQRFLNDVVARFLPTQNS
jgi:putative oxygen-independent coproporphyrinogen III oxidase